MINKITPLVPHKDFESIKKMTRMGLSIGRLVN